MFAGFANAETWIWKGGTDLNWFTAANWEDGSGNEATALTTGDSFTFDAVTPEGDVNYNPSGNFNIATIIFGSSLTAPVKITGGKITSLGNAVNNNASHAMEFANEVQFSSNINLTFNTKEIVMSGGATGTKIANHTNLYGNYTTTFTGDGNLGNNIIVKSGSTLKIPNARYYDHIARMSIEAGATCELNQAMYNNGTDVRIVNVLNGTLKIGTFNYFNGGDWSGVRKGGTTGVLVVGKVYNQAGKSCHLIPFLTSTEGRTIIGAGGIGNGTYCRVWDNGATYNIGSCADWDISFAADRALSKTYTSAGIYKAGSKTTTAILNFDTTDYYDNSIGRTITCWSNIYAERNQQYIKMSVNGKGKFVFANTSGGTLFTGGVTANDTSTVAINAGSRPGAGDVTMNAGTTLSIPEAGAGSATVVGTLAMPTGTTLAYSNIVVTVTPLKGNVLGAFAPAVRIDGDTVLGSGVHPLLTLSSGTIPDPSEFTLSGSAIPVDKDVSLTRSADSKTLFLQIFGEDDFVWTGEGSNGNFSSAENWMGGRIPNQGGEDVFFLDASGEIVNNLDGFAPKSITFCAEAGNVIISGNAITGVSAVTNLSVGVSPVINAAVTFGNGGNAPIDVLIAPGSNPVKFAGGVLGTTPKNHTSYSGIYTLTADSWIPASGSIITELSTVNANVVSNVPNNTIPLTIKSGATMQANQLYWKATSSAGKYIINSNQGTLSVGELRFVGVNGSTSSWCYPNSVAEAQRGVFRTGRLVMKDNGNGFVLSINGNYGHCNWVIGEGGLDYEGAIGNVSGGFCLLESNNAYAELWPSADWTLAWNNNSATSAGASNGNYGYTANAALLMRKTSVTHIHTRNYDRELDGSYVGRTVTLTGKASGYGSMVADGCGTLLFDSASDFQGGLTATGGVTVAVNTNCTPGSGSVTIGADSTLAVPKSSTVTIPGAVTLNNGAILSFHFTSVDEQPKFVFSTGATVKSGDTVTVKASAAEGVFPRNLEGKWLVAEGVSDTGSFALDTETKPTWAEDVVVEGGNLYLIVKRPGLSLSVR